MPNETQAGPQKEQAQEIGQEKTSAVGLSFGQKAVGLTFNPSNNPDVDSCKSGFANLIDQMNFLRATSASPEQKRLASVAITEAQGAQMFAVKALTWKD
jgi:hypothetical protein